MIDNIYLANIYSFASNNFDQLHKEHELNPFFSQTDKLPAEAVSLSCLLAAITYASACLSVSQPPRQTAWRTRPDERPIRQVIARVFFKF